MIKIRHEEINFHPTTEQKRKASRKIAGFNFIKDKAANLIMDSSIIEKGIVVIHGEYPYESPYLFLRFLDKNTLQDTRILVGAFDVLSIKDFGWEYQVDEKLTKMWRGVMLEYGPNYKKALIKTLEERKENSIKNYNNQIEEIEKF